MEKAEQERKDLERELQLLENAADPVESAKRVNSQFAYMRFCVLYNINCKNKYQKNILR